MPAMDANQAPPPGPLAAQNWFPSAVSLAFVNGLKEHPAARRAIATAIHLKERIDVVRKSAFPPLQVARFELPRTRTSNGLNGLAPAPLGRVSDAAAGPPRLPWTRPPPGGCHPSAPSLADLADAGGNPRAPRKSKRRQVSPSATDDAGVEGALSRPGRPTLAEAAAAAEAPAAAAAESSGSAAAEAAEAPAATAPPTTSGAAAAAAVPRDLVRSRLQAVPLFTVVNDASEFVLVSDDSGGADDVGAAGGKPRQPRQLARRRGGVGTRGRERGGRTRGASSRRSRPRPRPLPASPFSQGLFFLDQSGAEAVVARVAESAPALAARSRVVRVGLDRVYDFLRAPSTRELRGVGFRLVPAPTEVRHAVALLRQQRAEEAARRAEARSKAAASASGGGNDRGRRDDDDDDDGDEALAPVVGFQGCPVFQAEGLSVTQGGSRFYPLFLSRADLDAAVGSAGDARLAGRLAAGEARLGELDAEVDRLRADVARARAKAAAGPGGAVEGPSAPPGSTSASARRDDDDDDDDDDAAGAGVSSRTLRRFELKLDRAAQRRSRQVKALEKLRGRLRPPRIEVGALEDVVGRMERAVDRAARGEGDDEGGDWASVLFVPPGLELGGSRGAEGGGSGGWLPRGPWAK